VLTLAFTGQDFAANQDEPVSKVSAEVAKLRKIKQGLMEDLLTGRARMSGVV